MLVGAEGDLGLRSSMNSHTGLVLPTCPSFKVTRCRMRIVSLLPSTTEILFDLGAGDHVVGVTFECDHPAEARSRTIVSTSAMPEGSPRPRWTRS